MVLVYIFIEFRWVIRELALIILMLRIIEETIDGLISDSWYLILMGFKIFSEYIIHIENIDKDNFRQDIMASDTSNKFALLATYFM